MSNALLPRTTVYRHCTILLGGALALAFAGFGCSDDATAPIMATQLVLTSNAAGAPSGAAFTTQPVVAVRDAAGKTLKSDNSTVVTMTASTGATVVGTATATASSGVATFASVGITGPVATSITLTFAAPGLTSATQSITPTMGAVATVTVSPSSNSLTVSQTRQLTAELKDTGGNTVSGATVTWSSANAVATVSANGLVTAVAGGTASVTATSNGKTGTASIPVLAFGALAAGHYHSCGLTSTGAAYCWGSNESGEVGDGTKTYRLTPVPVVQGSLAFTALTAGERFSCGLTSAGAAYCWGKNFSGQLGDGTKSDRLTPVPVVQGSLAFTALTAGSSHTCGLTSAGAAHCWGHNSDGELGDGTTTDRLTPVPVVQGGLVVAALTAGIGTPAG